MSVQPPHAVVKSRAHAEVVKLVDTLASGASGGNPVEVQVLSSAPNNSHNPTIYNYFSECCRIA